MELKRIMVATDLSPRSDVAVRRAFALAREHGARVHLLHIVDDQVPAPVARDIRSGAARLMKDTVAGLGDRGRTAFETEIRFDDVWRGIVVTAEAIGADLIVLGTHRSRGIRDLFRGTTVERVVKAARIPVLLAVDAETADYRDAVVGVDLSPASLRAIEAAHRFAPQGKITLLSAYDVPFRDIIDRQVPGDSDIRAEKARVERVLHEQLSGFERTCPEREGGYGHVVVDADPAEALSAHVRGGGATLVCVGSHGRGWLSEAFLGNTAGALLARPPCDVLVTK